RGLSLSDPPDRSDKWAPLCDDAMRVARTAATNGPIRPLQKYGDLHQSTLLCLKKASLRRQRSRSLVGTVKESRAVRLARERNGDQVSLRASIVGEHYYSPLGVRLPSSAQSADSITHLAALCS